MRTSAVARSPGNAEQPLCRTEEASATGGTGQRRKKLNSNNRPVCCPWGKFGVLIRGLTHEILFWVRQLEAIIRISEALAKLTLSPVVKNHHVDEAIRLFKFSTMDAVSAGSADGLSRGELNQEMNKIEKEIRRRLPIGWSTSYQSLVKEFVNQQGYSSHALERTLFVMEKREILRFSNQASAPRFPLTNLC